MVLVYLKEPFGVLHIGNYKIYGFGTRMPPTDVSQSLFRADFMGDKRFRAATYREGYLKKLFGKEFSMVAFTYLELKYMPDKTLDRIASEIGIDGYKKRSSRASKVSRIQKSINVATEKLYGT